MRTATFLFLLFAALLPRSGTAQAPLRDGDIVFQTLPCGGLCDAIIATTPCAPGKRFNHCGVVRATGDSLFVIEAIGTAVQQTPLARFLRRDTAAAVAVGRPRYKNKKEARTAAQKAASYIGHPYDSPFLPGDSALYCSELVWESCRSEGQKLFTPAPMTFRTGGATHPAWTAYYRDLGVPPPEGVLGINPCALATSDRLHFFWLPKTAL